MKRIMSMISIMMLCAGIWLQPTLAANYEGSLWTGGLLELFAAAPSLGNYAPKTVVLSADTYIGADAAPVGALTMDVSTTANFNGKLEGNPTTGVIRVTDAHPAGVYT